MSVMLQCATKSIRKKSATAKRPAKSAKNETSGKPASGAAGPSISPKNLKMWAFWMDKTQLNCVFRRDTGDIWIGKDQISKDAIVYKEPEDDDVNGSVIEFEYKSQKCRIETFLSPTKEIDQKLFVGGVEVV